MRADMVARELGVYVDGGGSCCLVFTSELIPFSVTIRSPTFLLLARMPIRKAAIAAAKALNAPSEDEFESEGCSALFQALAPEAR